jgi:hypothetical protein
MAHALISAWLQPILVIFRPGKSKSRRPDLSKIAGGACLNLNPRSNCGPLVCAVNSNVIHKTCLQYSGAEGRAGPSLPRASLYPSWPHTTAHICCPVRPSGSLLMESITRDSPRPAVRPERAISHRDRCHRRLDTNRRARGTFCRTQPNRTANKEKSRVLTPTHLRRH